MTTVEPSTKQELADVVGSVTCGATWFTADTPHGKKQKRPWHVVVVVVREHVCDDAESAREVRSIS